MAISIKEKYVLNRTYSVDTRTIKTSLDEYQLSMGGNKKQVRLAPSLNMPMILRGDKHSYTRLEIKVRCLVCSKLTYSYNLSNGRDIVATIQEGISTHWSMRETRFVQQDGLYLCFCGVLCESKYAIAPMSYDEIIEKDKKINHRKVDPL